MATLQLALMQAAQSKMPRLRWSWECGGVPASVCALSGAKAVSMDKPSGDVFAAQSEPQLEASPASADDAKVPPFCTDSGRAHAGGKANTSRTQANDVDARMVILAARWSPARVLGPLVGTQRCLEQPQTATWTRPHVTGAPKS